MENRNGLLVGGDRGYDRDEGASVTGHPLHDPSTRKLIAATAH